MMEKIAVRRGTRPEATTLHPVILAFRANSAFECQGLCAPWCLPPYYSIVFEHFGDGVKRKL